MKWNPSTPGEEVYFRVRDDILPSLHAIKTYWHELHDVFDSLAGSRHFSDYLHGAMATSATRRLIHFWRSVGPMTVDAKRFDVMLRYVRGTIFPETDRSALAPLIRATFSAVEASGRAISNATRTRVLDTFGLCCYMCGFDLDPAVDSRDPRFVTLEHLWPNSLGGDSIFENLMPACNRCQRDKSHGIPWEWVAVHNTVLDVDPSDDSLTGVSRASRMARRYRHIMEVCRDNRWTLQEGFRNEGPWGELAFRPTGTPVTFFDLLA